MPPKAPAPPKEAPPVKETLADAPIDEEQYEEALDNVLDEGRSPAAAPPAPLAMRRGARLRVRQLE